MTFRPRARTLISVRNRLRAIGGLVITSTCLLLALMYDIWRRDQPSFLSALGRTRVGYERADCFPDACMGIRAELPFLRCVEFVGEHFPEFERAASSRSEVPPCVWFDCQRGGRTAVFVLNQPGSHAHEQVVCTEKHLVYEALGQIELGSQPNPGGF